MPNLSQIVALKERFGTLSTPEEKAKEFIERKRIKSDSIKKAFTFNERQLLENFNIANSRPDLISYFESNPVEEVVLLFIDITGFSRIVQNKSSLELRSYLNDYYSKLIPIIYKYEGQIEKIMGDGIICVFGKPFMTIQITSWATMKAENCSKEAIETFSGTDKAVKVAINIGTITYYKVPSDFYDEYTMIGNPLTELYRLESVSNGDAINFYAGSKYDQFNPKDGCNIFTDINANSVRLYQSDVSLPGVNYTKLRYLKFI